MHLASSLLFLRPYTPGLQSSFLHSPMTNGTITNSMEASQAGSQASLGPNHAVQRSNIGDKSSAWHVAPVAGLRENESIQLMTHCRCHYFHQTAVAMAKSRD